MKKTVLILLAALLLTACSNGNGGIQSVPADSQQNTDVVQTAAAGPQEVKSAKKDIFAMDTYMTVTCYGDRAQEAVDAAEKEILRLDELLSVGNPDSEISKLNEAGEGELSNDSKIMVEEALAVNERTGGAFDITVYPLMQLWGFTTQDYKVPKQEELKKVLETVGSGQLALKDGRLALGKGQGIDLGGIAKGYTSDRLMEIFEEYGLVSGIISLGGNVQLYGTKPDGSLWKCGIRDPHASDSDSSLLGVLQTADCAVITSGAYERYFEEDGKTYHHIIDPATGYPADNGLISVTIVSRQGILADALSTACYVMGLEKTIDFWKSSPEEFDLILMTADDEVYVTAPLKDAFSTDYPVHVIE